MSTESQSEKIWQYAMGAEPTAGGKRNASSSRNDGQQNGSSDGNGDATLPDFSDDLGSVPSKFSFHGLAQTQTQSSGAWLPNETLEGPESQKENMRLHPLSRSKAQLPTSAVPMFISHSGPALKSIGAPSSSGATPVSHVTQHVTGASQRASPTHPVVNPSNSSATAPSDSAPGMQQQNSAVCATPLGHKNKIVSFLSPRPPPAIPRIKTMPPRLNRYAPRDIDRSSQDSFADPPVPPDLNSIVRNSSIFTNTYIRSRRDGQPAAVFEQPSRISTTSLSDLPVQDEDMSASESQQQAAETSTSEVVRAAFDPRFSPPRALQPVVLVKDSQSQHSDGDNSNSALPSNPHSQKSSSSAVSYELPLEAPSEAFIVATQANTQPTQPNTQPTQTDLQPDIVVLPSIGTTAGEPSPLPVPPHRRREFAVLQATRLGTKDEVIPETPQSAVAPSVQASGATVPKAPASVAASQPAISDDAIFEGQPPTSTDTRHLEKGKGKQIAPEGDEAHGQRPLSKTKDKTKRTDAVNETALSNAPRSAAGDGKSSAPHSMRRKARRPRESEVIPDSQEEEQRRQQRQGPSAPAPEPSAAQSDRTRQGEVIPDSQEEEQADNPSLTSSPSVPLVDVLSRRTASKDSPLHSPMLESSSRTRRSGPASFVKDKRNAVKVSLEIEEKTARDTDALVAVQDGEGIRVSEQREQPELEPLALPVGRRKRTTSRLLKAKKIITSKAQTKDVRTTRSKKALTTTPVAGSSTRSKKRKNEAQAGSSRQSEMPITDLPLARKRQRDSLTFTPAPAAPLSLSTRIFARRADKGNYYLPGTVVMESVPTDSIPASTIFRVQFDDGHEDDVDVEYMRQFEIEPGDVVVHISPRTKSKGRKCIAQVLDVERWQKSEIAEVQELGRGPDGDDYDVEGRFISVSEPDIQEQWNERRVSTRTLLRDQDFDQPVHNESLAGIGFVITLPDLPRSKRSLTKIIAASSGLVYDDWSAVISFNCSVEIAGKRMVGRLSDLRVGKDTRKSLPRVLFCLTDEPRTTPKYLIALALGVPCLSIDWVLTRVVQNNVRDFDWPAYILPAGHNPVTRLPASQAFDRAWWRERHNLPQLLSRPPIIKPFAGKTFLCIGTSEFLFSKRDLGTFPKVLLAMGASHVQAVTDIEYVNLKRLRNFDYTVVDDGQPLIAHEDAVAVNVSWLKKCLVTGIEGPIPWPDREAL